MPVGALLLLVTTALKVRDELQRPRRRASAGARRTCSSHCMLLVVHRLRRAAADRHAGRVRDRHLGLRVLPAASRAAVDDPDPADDHRDAELRAARGAAVHPGRQLHEPLGHHASSCSKLATVLTGRMHGGLAQVSIALSTLMSGVTGSSIADAAMNSRLLGGEMLKRGFSQGLRRRRAVVRLADGADHPAGHRLHPLRHRRPGVDRPAVRRRRGPRAACCGRRWRSRSRSRRERRGYMPERTQRPTAARTRQSRRWGGIWAILFPVILLLGLRFGIFTPSEIGAFAVVYAVAIGVFVYRQARSAPSIARRARGQPGRRRRGDVPARAVGDLRLRHRVRDAFPRSSRAGCWASPTARTW